MLNKINIFLFIVFFIFSSIFVFVFYKSEIIYNGSNRSYYTLYYLCSFFFLSLSLISIIIKNKTFKINTIIFIIMIFISCYIFEIGVRLFTQFKNNEKIQKHVIEFEKQNPGEKFDLRNKIEIYEDLLKTNKDIAMNVPPSFYLLNQNSNFHPLTSKSNSITINCNENGYYQIIKTDRYGFNNDDEIWNNNKFDFVFVGDSFTQGACVNKPDDIVSQFEILANQTVLNLGYGSNGPISEYATLREYLEDKEFDNLVWLFYEGNDISEMYKELRNPILKKYIENENFSQQLIDRQDEINKISEKIINDLYKTQKNKPFINFSSLKDFLKLSNLRSKLNLILPHKSHFGVLQPLPDENFNKVFKKIRKFSLNKNAKLYFVYLPEYKRYVNEIYDDRSYNKIKKIIKSFDIQFIDLKEGVFNKLNNPLNMFPFGSNGHYTEEGYRITGNYIYKKIEK